jgi:hypothetical protein
MKYLALALLIAAVAVWSYDIGTVYPSVRDDRLAGLTQAACDDIIRYPGEKGLVCEVNMIQEDDNLKIYKGE